MLNTNTEPGKTLVERACTRMGWSKMKLARELGVSSTTVYRWCREDNKFPPAPRFRATLEELGDGGVNREAYRFLGRVLREHGPLSLTSLRNRLLVEDLEVTENELQMALLALADDGFISFAWDR